ncbi:hypothetical protein ATC00_09750 [Sinorhizobium americanum]|nr:hypothetical protein ATC00_09750 [Sinorhizobium americanum]
MAGYHFAVIAHYDAYLHNAGAFAQAVCDAGGTVDFLTLSSRGMEVSGAQLSSVCRYWPALQRLKPARIGIEALRDPSLLALYSGLFFGAGGEELLVGFRNLREGFASLGSRRPVVVTGFPGIVDAGRTAGMLFRCPSDIVLLPASAQLRVYRLEMSLLGKRTGNGLLYGMPSLPPPAPISASLSPIRRILFIDQSVIPDTPDDRRALVVELARLLDNLPNAEIWIRERVREGETSIHELGSAVKLSKLVAELKQRLPALARVKMKHEPLTSLFGQVDAAISISSTGLLEAFAAGLPIASLERFSRVPKFGNGFFRTSGIQVDVEELSDDRWPAPNEKWVQKNILSPTQISNLDQLTGQQRLVQKLAAIVSSPRRNLPNPVEHGPVSRQIARWRPHVLVQRAFGLFSWPRRDSPFSFALRKNNRYHAARGPEGETE